MSDITKEHMESMLQLMESVDYLYTKIKTLENKVAFLEEKLIEVSVQNEKETTINHKISTRESENNSSGSTSIANSSNQTDDLIPYPWCIMNMKVKNAAPTWECRSKTFPVNNGYHFFAKFKLKVNRDSLELSICFIDLNKTGRPLGLELAPKVTYVIRDRSENKDKRDVKRHSYYVCDASLDYNKYLYHVKINKKQRILNYPYVINDFVLIDVFVEPQSVARKTEFNEGTVTWKIENYSKNKAWENEGLVLTHPSPYFYTSENGYRMQVAMKLNINGGLKAKIVFLKSSHDGFLPKTFEHKTIVVIENVKDRRSHLCKTVDMVKTHYFNDYLMDIATHSQIENENFLIDDTLIITAIIRAT